MFYLHPFILDGFLLMGSEYSHWESRHYWNRP